jgi:hypothetical protein
MSLTSDIANIMSGYIQKFCQEISEKTELSCEELTEIWENVSSQKITSKTTSKPATKTTKKPMTSAYGGCVFIITRGERKGQPCGKNTTSGSTMCSAHNKSAQKTATIIKKAKINEIVDSSDEEPEEPEKPTVRFNSKPELAKRKVLPPKLTKSVVVPQPKQQQHIFVKHRYIDNIMWQKPTGLAMDATTKKIVGKIASANETKITPLELSDFDIVKQRPSLELSDEMTELYQKLTDTKDVEKISDDELVNALKRVTETEDFVKTKKAVFQRLTDIPEDEISGSDISEDIFEDDTSDLDDESENSALE